MLLVAALSGVTVLAGGQNGGQDGGLKSRYIKQEFEIPMRDGVTLFTIVYVRKVALDALLRGPHRREVGVEHDQRRVVGPRVADAARLPDQRVAPTSACASMFAGDMFLPAALMMISFLRSTIRR